MDDVRRAHAMMFHSTSEERYIPSWQFRRFDAACVRQTRWPSSTDWWLPQHILTFYPSFCPLTPLLFPFSFSSLKDDWVDICSG